LLSGIKILNGFKFSSLVFFLWALAFSSDSTGCPFCPPVSSTLAEQFSESSIVVLAEWNSTSKDDKKSQTIFAPLKMEKGNKKLLKSKQFIITDEEYQGQKGDLFLLFTEEDNLQDWQEIIPVSEASYQYILQAPGLETETKKRLSFFLRFLEYPDPLIADDAFSEFAQASFEDVFSLNKKYPVSKIRKWIQNTEMPATRIGLYSLMLGLSGNKKDAEFLKKRMQTLDNEFHLGLDGMMAGYVLLSGNQGLEYLNQNYLSRKDASSSESFAAMKALRFLHQHARDKVDSKLVEASMRLLLKRPSMTELVIIDLTRWKDWSIAHQLMKLYEQPEHDNRPTRRAIISYLLLFTNEKINSTKIPESFRKKVVTFLSHAKIKHPRAYREAKRFLNLN
jgi:hypothetical protein